ncbi:MAG: helix-turn-helix transcriptional regulator [Bacteroidales bacterium]|nr:helix-turn-helix transcriptional regulator [Bacteroidales bacterium]MBN2756259.1 helix-turn-helix transcriptional regulator [Bacteroidales bacterium]
MEELKIHNRLRLARIKLNLNQIQIADDLQIQQKSISELENGKLLNIPNRYIYYFHKKGVSLKWIYDGLDEMMISDKIDEKKEIVNNKLFEEIGDELIENSISNNIIDRDTKIDKTSDYFYERIINSKDFTIKVLLKYLNQQMEIIELLKK